ncbi:hypothetical protein [Paraliomyxa miuraensis]|uniref:hypothetical protein n=1 Tax=Paraliomyxa miuraensis TaxID=376150 RepID=UPI00224EDCAD|nr:hypothetical protein [Paraliomyxa miuraensis]MCX4244010.1 hypothetical protein [Paraliomyxa miuraensis]
MRRSTLALLTTLSVPCLLPGCGDDLPDFPLTGADGSTSASGGPDGSGTSATLPGTSTAVPTTEAPTTSPESTGPGFDCGNGVVDEGEQCDDGNLDNQDGCYTSCVVPYEVLWTATHNGGEDDVATEALFDAEGNLYVLGSTQVEGQGYDVWLRQYTPDGREGWTWTHDGALHGDDFGSDLAWHESGDLLISGSEVTENDDDVLVIRLRPEDQSVVWMRYHDGVGLGPGPNDDVDFANDVRADADGNVLVAGAERVDGSDSNAWLRKYDADGTDLWTVSYDGPAGSSTATSVVVADDGTIYLMGNHEVGPSTTEGWVRKLDADGGEQGMQALPGSIVNHGTLDSQGNLVLVGIDVETPGNENVWAAKYDPDFTPIGSHQFEGSSGATDVGLNVALDGGDGVYLVGYFTVVGQSADIWATRTNAGLSLQWWTDGYGNEEAKLDDVARGVAVSNDGTRVAVIGSESVIFEDRNTWVRMIQNNPVPLQ